MLHGLLVTVLLVPAGAISIARLAQPPGGGWTRLVAFTPYALPLYLLALVLLVVAWASASGGWLRVAATFTVAALAGAVLHGVWVSRAFVGGTVAPDRGEPYRVMTLNLMLGQASAADVVLAATEHEVDVLVLQEVDQAALERLDKAGLSDLLPERAGEPADGAAGTMVLARRALDRVTELGTGFGGYQVEQRNLTIVAVHARPPVGTAADWASDQRIIRRAAYDRSTPALIVGDLNATTDHRVLRELEGRGYVDAATSADAGWQPTWPADGQVRVGGVAVPPLLALDHVLINEVLHVVSTEAVAIEGTDHRALVAELSR